MIICDLCITNRNLYFGSNGANNVYSFLPTSGTIPSFNADINLFLKVLGTIPRLLTESDCSCAQYLTANQGVSTAQFLTTAQGGTEATSGSATLTTYVAYLLVFNLASSLIIRIF